MTPKEARRLSQLRDSAEAGTLSESDVSAFLMILREHVGDGVVKEFSHHIAHSERDRGRFFRRILSNKEALDNLGRKPGRVISGDVFSVEEFGHDLNKALRNCKLPALSDEAIERLTVFVISLLQGCSYKKREKFAELSVSATSAHICLNATVKIKFKGKEVPASFVVLTVPNRWLEIGNPRANVMPDGLLDVYAQRGQLQLNGFKPFKAYIEREPSFSQDDLDAAIEADARLSMVSKGTVRATLSDGGIIDLSWDGAKLTFYARSEYLHSSTEGAQAIASLANRLQACVHDDSNAHWFLPGLEVADDGYHSHWIGHRGPTCNKPL